MSYFASKQWQMKPPSLGRLFYGVAITLLLISAMSPLALSLEQSTSLRLFYALRGPIEAPKDIAIIALNSSAATALEQSNYSGNWPRTIHAELINKLHQANAQLTVIDIAFKDVHNEHEDAKLQQSLINNPNVILFTYLKRHQIDTGAGIMDVEQELPPIPRFQQHALTSGSFTLPKYPAHVYNTQLFNRLSSGITATQPVLAFLARQDPSDLEALWNTHSHTKPMATNLNQLAQQLVTHIRKINTSGLSSKQRHIANVLKHTSPVTINFYGPAQTVKTWSIDSALSMNQNDFENAFKDTTVYVGFSDNIQTEQQDAYLTVFSSDLGVDLSGVEISATVFSNLMANEFIRTPQPWLIISMTCLALLLGFTSYQVTAFWCPCLQVLVFGLYLVLGHGLFSYYNLWLPITLPSIGLIISNSFMLSRRFNQNKKRMQQVQFALSQYLPNEAAKKLSRNVTSLEKQHQLVHGVCLMTDIQGYTTLSETLAPDVLHKLMNTYYAELVETVEQNGGFIGNLVGDGMLALWTGPQITPEMCQAALTAAQQIQQRINNNPKLEHPLPTCSAIHGGQFSLGNLGALGHFEYSPVGDIINTVSRVEHFNRNLGTHFLCTAPIAEQLAKVTSDKTKLRHLGSFTFRHKSKAMPLYDLAEGINQEQLNTFVQALNAYENEAFEQSKMLFEDICKTINDGPSRYFLAEMASTK